MSDNMSVTTPSVTTQEEAHLILMRDAYSRLTPQDQKDISEIYKMCTEGPIEKMKTYRKIFGFALKSKKNKLKTLELLKESMEKKR